MPRVALATLCSLAILTGIVLLAQQPTRPVPRAAAEATTLTHQMSVTGEGTASVTPDTAHLSLGVDLQGPSLAPLQQEAAQRIQAALEALQHHGLQSDKVRTVSYTVSIQTDQEGRPVGYHVRSILDAPIQPVDQAGAALDAAIAAGANVVESVRFTRDDVADAMRQARTRAVQDAQTKAQQLAQAAGITLGPIVSLSESSITPPPIPVADRVAAGASPTTPLPTGELTIRVTVNIIYSIP